MTYLLTVISGPDVGVTYPLTSTTIIGRSSKAQLRLSNQAISWEHALITRTGEEYFVENLSALGTSLNDTKLTAKTKLRLRDQIKLTDDTIVRVDPADGSCASLLSNPKFLAAALALVVIVGALVLWFNPLADQEAPPDWAHAYIVISAYVQDQTDARQFPAETPMLLRDAWRLDSVGDYKSAQPVWLRLAILLDNQKELYPALKAAEAAKPDALNHLLIAKPNAPAPSDEEIAAATFQFTARRLAFANKKIPTNGFFK